MKFLKVLNTQSEFDALYPNGVPSKDLVYVKETEKVCFGTNNISGVNVQIDSTAGEGGISDEELEEKINEAIAEFVDSEEYAAAMETAKEEGKTEGVEEYKNSDEFRTDAEYYYTTTPEYQTALENVYNEGLSNGESQGYENGLNEGKSIGAEEYKNSSEYASELQNSYNDGYGVGYNNGVEEYKNSDEYQNDLQSKYDEGISAAEETLLWTGSQDDYDNESDKSQFKIYAITE